MGVFGETGFVRFSWLLRMLATAPSSVKILLLRFKELSVWAQTTDFCQFWNFLNKKMVKTALIGKKRCRAGFLHRIGRDII